MRENTDQKLSEYRYFSRIVIDDNITLYRKIDLEVQNDFKHYP